MEHLLSSVQEQSIAANDYHIHLKLQSVLGPLGLAPLVRTWPENHN